MEEIRDTIANNDHPVTTIVSTMTTVTENGTNITLITPQTIDNFEPDPKWEMTTLEKASYEPTTQEQEDGSVFDSCILNQSSVDTQMEKVIDDIVELDRCQQFVQPSDYHHHHHQDIAFDREKEVASIQREISGEFNSETPEKSNTNDKVQQNELSINIENNEQRALSATFQQSNQDLKQTDDKTTPESSLAVPQLTMNDQDLSKIDPMSTEVNTEAYQLKLVTTDLADNNDKIREVEEAKVIDSSEGAVNSEIGTDEVGEAVETSFSDTTHQRTSDTIEEETETKEEKASGIIKEETETKEDEASETIEDKTSEVDETKAIGTNREVVASGTEVDELSEVVETSILDKTQEKTSGTIEEETETKEEIPPDAIEEEIESGEDEAFETIEDKIFGVNEKDTPCADEEAVVSGIEIDELSEAVDASISDTIQEKPFEEETKTKEEKVFETIEEKISGVCREKVSMGDGEEFSVHDKRKIRDYGSVESNLDIESKAPTSIPLGTRRRSKRAKVDREPHVEEKVKVERSIALKPDYGGNLHKCSHCEYASLRIDNLIYHINKLKCKPLQMLWKEHCRNEVKKVLQRSSATKKRTTR